MTLGTTFRVTTGCQTNKACDAKTHNSDWNKGRGYFTEESWGLTGVLQLLSLKRRLTRRGFLGNIAPGVIDGIIHVARHWTTKEVQISQFLEIGKTTSKELEYLTFGCCPWLKNICAQLFFQIIFATQRNDKRSYNVQRKSDEETEKKLQSLCMIQPPQLN